MSTLVLFVPPRARLHARGPDPDAARSDSSSIPTSAGRSFDAGAFGSTMRCQLTSASASTATTFDAFGSSAAAQRPC